MMTRRILVVDDETYVRDLLARVLKRRPYDVDLAADADEALGLLAEHHYDLLLTDVVMPGMDGFELLRLVKAAYPQMTVIVLTGYARKQSISDFLLYGADDYLSKPFQVQTLLEAVDRALDADSPTAAAPVGGDA
jgi:CheY-like chemotaxis protein